MLMIKFAIICNRVKLFKHLTLPVCLLLFLTSDYPGMAATTIVYTPSELIVEGFPQEGNTAGYLPFYNVLHGPFTARYQQVILASEFGGKAGYIRGIGFRCDGPGEDAGIVSSNLQVSFSTTTATSVTLSRIFAQNIGPDEALFWGPREVSLGLHRSPFGPPHSFSAALAADQPFYYDSRNGNLLLEIKNFAGYQTWRVSVDAHTHTSDGAQIRSVYARDVNAVEGSNPQSGFVMAIYLDIPPPSLLVERLAANYFQIKWRSSYTNFVLQSTTNLVLPNWQAVSEAKQELSGFFYHRTLNTNTARFFRLLKQP